MILTLNVLMRLYENTMAHGSNVDYLYFIERTTICVLWQGGNYRYICRTKEAMITIDWRILYSDGIIFFYPSNQMN